MGRRGLCRWGSWAARWRELRAERGRGRGAITFRLHHFDAIPSASSAGLVWAAPPGLEDHERGAAGIRECFWGAAAVCPA